MTNESLSEQMQEKFPPQVVFRREQGDVLSQTVDMFLSNRECIGVDEAVSNVIELLFAPEEQEEEVDIDAITLDDEGADEAQGGDEGSGEVAEEPAVLAATANNEAPNSERMPVFEPASVSLEDVQYDLDDAFVSFRTLPIGSGNMVQVEFNLSGKLTRQNLWDIFTDLGSFVVDSEVERVSLDIAEVVTVEIGVSPNGAAVGTVYLEAKPAEDAATMTPVPGATAAPAQPILAVAAAPVVLQQVQGAPAAQLTVAVS